ncbi:MAG TPA: hypothetical protein DD426_03645, partial [Clostridiaceae bacterium]|nr:hypothetical protein [Clostridiaceae bacterium]
MKFLKICIDPGHGGNDPGALGRQSKEKDINLALASKLEQKLTKSGIQVVMTRTSDATLDLQKRCDIANKGNCDYFMSIHCNSFNNASAAGTEAYYYKGSKAGQELAGKILNAAVESGHLKNRGVKTAGFYVLKFTKMPAVLLETAFISNPDEEKFLRNDSWQDGVMKNIAIAVCNYLKITPNVEDILYRVLNQGVQVGAFKIKENAIRLAEEVLAEISSGNVKVVASNGVIIFDKVKEPESSKTGPVSDAAVHPITDLRRASAEQMESFLHKINPNAPYIAQKYIDMGMKEGIRGDIAFAQAIKETNYFRFTGSVKAEQN